MPQQRVARNPPPAFRRCRQTWSVPARGREAPPVKGRSRAMRYGGARRPTAVPLWPQHRARAGTEDSWSLAAVPHSRGPRNGTPAQDRAGEPRPPALPLLASADGGRPRPPGKDTYWGRGYLGRPLGKTVPSRKGICRRNFRKEILWRSTWLG